MGPLVYMMAIMGCGDGSTSCVQARVEPIRYTSLVACQRAMPAGIARNTDLSFPVIAASCQAIGVQTARVAGSRRARG